MPVKTIAYCTPSLGTVSMWWARMTASIFHPNNYSRALFFAKDEVGDEVAEVRNCIVKQVLDYDREHHAVTHLFWIDDDVLVQPGCLLELLNHDRDIISGVYFLKHEGALSTPLIYPESGGGPGKFLPDQVQDVWGHGMGLTLVRTEVYKRMLAEQLTRTTPDGKTELLADKYGQPMWYHKTDSMTEIEEDEHGLCRMGMTEDTYFLNEAAKLGYQPSVSTHKHAFGFHYQQVYACECGYQTNDAGPAYNHRRANSKHRMKTVDTGYPQKQFAAWQRGEPIVWDTPAGPVTWT